MSNVKLAARVTAIVGTIVAMALVLLLTPGFLRPSVAFAECTVPEGSEIVYKMVGAQYSVSGITGIRANLWNYNPAPVYKATGFWVMLTDGSNYAQTGWWEYDGITGAKEYVWSQYSWNGGGNWETKWYNTSTALWQDTPHTEPPSSKEYSTMFVPLQGEYNQAQMQYDGGTTRNVSITWTPTKWQSFGETLNYDTPNKGDHVPGDTTNKIHGDNVMYRDSSYSWQSASMSNYKEGHGDVELIYQGFRIWDTRCSE
ncbi:MAG: hypothetical protein HYU30_07170 [Chloroflexi bacterium]|nr:hypothetical protein [Chloroflexota bacterium]